MERHVAAVESSLLDCFDFHPAALRGKRAVEQARLYKSKKENRPKPVRKIRNDSGRA